MTHKPLLSDESHKHSIPQRRASTDAAGSPAPAQQMQGLPTVQSMPVLALQRSVGNAAVQKLLRSTVQRAPAIQRRPGAEQAQKEHGYVSVPDLRIGALVLGPALRSRISSVVKQGGQARTKRDELDGLVEHLKMAAEANGPAAAKSVASIYPKAKRLHGEGRDSLEGAIDKYNSAKPHLRALMSRVEGARSRITESTKTLEAEVLGKELIGTRREKEDQEGKLKELEDNRASANAVLTGFINFAKILSDPAQGWSTALSTATSMVGSYIQDLALGGTYAQQIAAVRDKIERLTQSIKGLEDAQALAKIASAAAKLAAAQHDLAAALSELQGAVRAAEAAQDDLQEELRKLGKPGTQAANALDEGTTVVEISNEAIAKSLDQQGALEVLKEDIEYTFRHALRYREMLDGNESNLKGNERAWARDAAIENVRAAESWKRWVETELAHLGQAQKFLTGRSYLAGYEKGAEEALQDIRMGRKP
jgi:chromosome segregation ATPase